MTEDKPSNVNVREAIASDVEFVVDLMERALQPYYGGDHKAHAQRIFNAHLEGGQDNVGFFSNEQRMFIMEVNGVKAGMVHLVGKRQGTYKISPLIIHPDFRDTKGLGSLLLDFAKDYVTTHNAKQLYCTVAETNMLALKFFIKKGFVIAGKSDSHYKEGVRELMLYKALNFQRLTDSFDNTKISIIPCEKKHYGEVKSLLLEKLPHSFKDIDEAWVNALFNGYERKDTKDINLKYKIVYVAVNGDNKVCGVVGATPKKGEPIKIMPLVADSNATFLSLLYDIPYLLKEYGRKLYIHIVPNVEETILLQRSGWSLDAMLPGAYHDSLITQQWSFNLNNDSFMRMLRVKNKYLQLIKKGVKTLEIRVGYDSVKSIKIGEKIDMRTADDSCKVTVVDIRNYPTFKEMLDVEDYARISDIDTKVGVLDLLSGIYPPHKEKLGVVVLDIMVVK